MDDEINFLILDGAHQPPGHRLPGWIEGGGGAYEDLLFVSHDRYFINRFAARIWELADGTITDYTCGFAQYRQLKAQEAVERGERPRP